MKTQIALYISLSLLLTGCAGPLSGPGSEPARDDTPETPALTKSGTPSRPAAAPIQKTPAPESAPPAAKPPESLSGELLYYLLAAELAGQRGRLDIAVPYYLKAAELSRDPEVVERATRIAVYARDDASALAAARLWVELKPDNPEAHQVLAALLLRTGEVDEAIPHLERVLSHDGQNGRNGYMLITSLLSKEKDKQVAMAAMERLIEKRRQSPEALYAYARLGLLVGSLRKAEQAIDQALALRPDWPEALILKAQILLREGKHREALAFLKDTVEEHPDNVALRLVYARKLVDEKQYEAAREQFEILLDYQPDAPDALYALGLLNLQTRRPEEAQHNFERLIELGQRVDESYYYLGQAAEMRKQTEEAIRYDREVRKGQHYVDAEIRIAVLLAEQGDIEAARERLQNVSATTLDTELRLFLAEGEILVQAGRLEEALEVYNMALQQMPGNADLLYARALVNEKLDNIDAAVADLQRIVDKNPDNPQALNALGYTLVDRAGRVNEGLIYIEKALKLKPDDPAIMDSMGWALYRLGRHREALRYLQQAFDKLNDPEIAAHLGEVLWVQGDQEQARKIWEKALRETPNDKVLLNVIQRFAQ
ncbi:MAG: tetratricopeptide repeat protein [Alphaproteobacteria bacterium]